MRILNLISKMGYWILIGAPVLYFAAATYSYYSVFKTFGEVPLPHNTLEELAKTRQQPIHIFPVKYGELLLGGTIYGFLIFPFFILIHYLLHKKVQLEFNKKTLVIFIIVYLLFIFLNLVFPSGEWYMTYILD